MAAKDILFPIGRLVGGSVTTGSDTDSKGQKKTIKTGPNAGQPLMQWSFGVAIPKGAEQAWTQTAWGALIYQAAIEGYPNGETQHPSFSWKVIDGDSAIPNKNLKKPCEQTGYPGHWVVWFSSAAAPKLYDIIGNKQGDAPRPLLSPMEIVNGYYVQVYGSAKDNKPSETPGVYLNHSLVALAGYGERITQGPDANTVGFGGAPLPAGASAIPVGMSMTPPAAAAYVPPAPAPAAAYVPPAPAAQIPVAPNPAILATPPAPPAPPAPPPPAPAADPMGAPAGFRMTAAYTYAQLQAAQYSNEQMIAQGFMAAA